MTLVGRDLWISLETITSFKAVPSKLRLAFMPAVNHLETKSESWFECAPACFMAAWWAAFYMGHHLVILTNVINTNKVVPSRLKVAPWLVTLPVSVRQVQPASLAAQEYVPNPNLLAYRIGIHLVNLNNFCRQSVSCQSRVCHLISIRLGLVASAPCPTFVRLVWLIWL